ncbi:CobU Adenosyl cobinamide kinase/adenosyl cobinamide phosphate guanylyltransferase [Burkholderiaceae bacterium]|jgi:adenosylcobinamide kinase/adenosylcobinamide-phosphate guanylyltransferase
MTQVVRSEFILGGQKSGKSRRAESLAQHWLTGAPQRSALLIATAQAFDDEMRLRIERHRQDRLVRVPGMKTIEEPLALAATIKAFSYPDTLIVIDCLTLWLTAQLMPPNADLVATASARWQTLATDLCSAIAQAHGPLVLVGNEIGLGVIPLGHEVRAFVDALGLLNQMVAATCVRVTLMSAGLPLNLKGPA